jgi:hypothetical protein
LVSVLGGAFFLFSFFVFFLFSSLFFLFLFFLYFVLSLFLFLEGRSWVFVLWGCFLLLLRPRPVREPSLRR